MNKVSGSEAKNTLLCSFCGKTQREVRKLGAAHHPPIRILEGSMPPLALSDDQISIIEQMAAPLAPADRPAYLERVAPLLADVEIAMAASPGRRSKRRVSYGERRRWRGGDRASESTSVSRR